MHRREFFHTTAGALAAAGAQAETAQPAAGRKANLKLGTQHGDSDDILKVMAALGVNHICGQLPSAKLDQNWSVEALTRRREHVESFGLKLEAVPLPLSSAYITKSESPNIMLGKSPERDREIDNICQMIRNASEAGIRLLKYNMSILGVVRTESTTGRGGATYSTFNYEKAANRATLTEAGPVSAEEAWERIGYFVKRVIPVAEEHKVRLACHPHDPAMPEPQGFRGVHRAGTQRDESCPSTRYFGSRGKIFNVHFRNIKGGFLDFQETFPDNGDVDFIRAIRTYKEVGYDGLLMPDHVPEIAGDAGGRQAFAYCFGYIQALIQMVNQEA